jgi:hypothetical protein
VTAAVLDELDLEDVEVACALHDLIVVGDAQVQVLGVADRGQRELVDVFEDVGVHAAAHHRGHRPHHGGQIGERDQQRGRVRQPRVEPHGDLVASARVPSEPMISWVRS